MKLRERKKEGVTDISQWELPELALSPKSGMFPGPSPTTVPEKVSVHGFKTHQCLIISWQELCFSPQCIVLSASVLSSLDVTQDPCENFYDFASMSFFKSYGLLRAQLLKMEVGSVLICCQRIKAVLANSQPSHSRTSK